MNRQADYPPALKALIAALRKLPGIGPRSAERMAVWLATSAPSSAREISAAVAAVQDGVQRCFECGFFCEKQRCGICLDESRDRRILCVVEGATDVIAIERAGAYSGLYHVLGGRLSPLDGVGPEELGMERLEARVRNGAYSEIILALSADVEGEATASFLAGMLKPLGVCVTRIAHGLPAGAGLETADRLTLYRALSGRRPHGEP